MGVGVDLPLLLCYMVRSARRWVTGCLGGWVGGGTESQDLEFFPPSRLRLYFRLFFCLFLLSAREKASGKKGSRSGLEICVAKKRGKGWQKRPKQGPRAEGGTFLSPLKPI